MSTIARPPLIKKPQRFIADVTAYRQAKSMGIGTFRAKMGADQDNIPDVTWTKVTFNTLEHDVSNWYDTSNARYTPLQKGFYRFSATVRIDTDVATTGLMRLALYKNGTRHKELDRFYDSLYNRVYTLGGTTIAEADGDDYFEVFFYQDTGGNTPDIDTDGVSEWFQGEFIAYQGS